MTDMFRSAQDVLAGLAAKDQSAAELMQDTIDRVDQVNGSVNAIVAMRDSDELMAEARALDAGPNTGPLHGLPFAVKDLADVAGLPTTQGSPFFKDFVPEHDDAMVARLRAAGAVFIGKTNTPEFGLGSHTFNPVYGATCNPYDLGRSAGGSSGGAAVALATGMLALADGSDMMGSLRNPAGWNNVYGLRPSWGRVLSEPIGDTFMGQLATLGPMGRSPADIAILLDVMSGPDPRHPHGYLSEAVAPLEPAQMQGKRIGWLGDWGGAFAMEPGIMELSEEALGVFDQLGASVEAVAPPFSADQMWDSWVTLRSWTVAMGKGMLLEQNAPLKDTAIWEIEHGLALSAAQVHQASVVRSDWFKVAAALFDSYDALILPSAQIWPFDVNLAFPTQINGVEMDTYHRWMQVVVPVSLLGLPSLCVPAGFGANGLPAGLQLFGRRGSDAEVLAIGQAYHDATQWPQKRPAMV